MHVLRSMYVDMYVCVAPGARCGKVDGFLLGISDVCFFVFPLDVTKTPSLQPKYTRGNDTDARVQQTQHLTRSVAHPDC